MGIEQSLLQQVKDVKIEKVEVYTSSNHPPISILPIIAELNYFEDIFSNCVTGNVLISDSLGLPNRDSWCGDEYLVLSFGKPLAETIYNPINKIFKIYSITKRALANDTNENYVLNFCSEELLLSQKIRICRTYKNKTISEIVKSIAYEYLKITPEEFPDSHIEPTYGTYDITIPNLKPFQAINWLCNLAISDYLPKGKESGASYLFWQTKNGYYFKSILNIFNNMQENFYSGWAHAGYYWHGIKNADINENIGNKDPTTARDRPDESQHILSYNILNTYDSLESIRKGMYANKAIGIDYVTRTKIPVSFDYTKYFGSDHGNGYLKSNIELYKNKAKYSILNESRDRFNKTINEYNDVVLKIYPTTTHQNENSFIKANSPKIKDYNIEQTMSYRIAQFGLLSHSRLKLIVPGDHNLSVGMLIKINIPQTFVDFSKKVQPQNRFLSGYYLITASRHLVDSNNDFNTILEVRKSSYDRLVEVSNNKEGLDNALNDVTYKKLSSKSSI